MALKERLEKLGRTLKGDRRPFTLLDEHPLDSIEGQIEQKNLKIIRGQLKAIEQKVIDASPENCPLRADRTLLYHTASTCRTFNSIYMPKPTVLSLSITRMCGGRGIEACKYCPVKQTGIWVDLGQYLIDLK